MRTLFRPSSTLTTQELQRSLRTMVWESLSSTIVFGLGSGGFMAAYALALGANNLQVGLLAALPFLTQVMQIPGILAVERFRMRKAMGVPALIASHLIWLPIAAVPFLLAVPGALAISVVIGLLAARGLFAPVWVTAWSSWMRDLVPREILGRYHAQRLAIATAGLAIVGLGASYFVQWWKQASAPADEAFAYSFLLIGGTLTLGTVGVIQTLRTKEPLMPPSPQAGHSALALLLAPLRDKNFSQLVRFLFVWNLTSNIAIPFFAVYMLTAMGLPLPAVIGFTVVSQVSNIVFVRVWGPMTDRLGSKAVLSLAASLYLLVIIGWVFALNPERHILTLPLLGALHLFAGVAAAGVTLTISTLALKEAPEEQATAFLGVAGIATYLGAGLGPIVGGVLADYFAQRTLRFDISWISPDSVLALPALSLTGYEFLFVIAFVTGSLSLNLLVALREEGEVPREIALSELTSGIRWHMNAVSSVPGIAAVSAISLGYLKRMPGADVALGVTAYQLAASTQAAVSSLHRGRTLMRNVAHAVGGVLGDLIDTRDDLARDARELARHATRGAIQVGEEFTGHLGRITRGAVLGTLEVLARSEAPVGQSLAGAGYGAVQGAIEAGEDPSQAAAEAVEAAREAAEQLGIDPGEAASLLVLGALDAAAASGEEILTSVREALPADPA